MEDRVLYYSPVSEVFDDDSLEQFRSDARVPNTLGIDNHYRAALTHAEAWRLASFDTVRSEQQLFSLQQRCEHRIERPSAPVGRAKTARTYDDMPGIRFHGPW